MDFQKIIEQSIALLFPLLIIFFFIYYMLKAFFDQFEKQRKQELLVRFSKETLPLRLQAYERLALLLERIKPESMVMRVTRPGMTTLELEKILLENVREEFEHNLSQQIYVSPEAWYMVVSARQTMIQLITSTAEENNPDGLYVEYATDLLKEFATINDDTISNALKYLQKEAKEIM
jgi:hypothetical protein